MRLDTLLVISLLVLGIVAKGDVAEGCKNISISTQMQEDGEFAFDIMDKGQLNDEWKYEDDTIKDSDSTEMDFLYITVFGKHDKLTRKNFEILTNSTTMTANSTLFVEKVVDHGENKTYSLRINYRCNEDASAMIKLNFKINSFTLCPSNTNIFWTRKCGDNEPPRMGLQMDYNIKHKYNHTIVTDGVLIAADYFSEDYDTYVLRIPPKIQYSLFYVSLNVSSDIIGHNDYTLEGIEKLFKEKDPKEKLQIHDMQFQKDLVVKAVTLNYDVQIVDVTVKGAIVNGGVVNAERDAIYLEYKCRRGGVSGIQMTLEMDHFKNVNIFFEKECPLQPGEGSGMFGTVAFFILIFFIIIIFVTLYNVFALEIRGVKAVPFAVTVLTGISKIPGLKGSSFGNSLYNLANPSYTNTLTNDTVITVSNQVSQDEREFKDSEFKIKNIAEKDEESNLDDSTAGPSNAVQLGNYGSI